MFSLLHTYLLENRSVLLAGTGKLQLVKQPAVYDVANQLLEPPHTNLEFTGSKEKAPDSLIAFIASRLNIASDQAAALYQSFCDNIRNEIAASGLACWPNLGSFVKETAGNIVFKADEAVSSINKALPAVRVIRQGKTHAMVVGDSETTSTQMQEYFTEQAIVKPAKRWWVAALIIGVAALTLILLKKMQYL